MPDSSTTPASAPVSDIDDAELTLEYLLRRMRFKSDFPALSTSVSRVQALSNSETDSMQSLCDEVLQDVALTQKLLRVVNTAHFRRAGTDPISTVSRAVALIGAGGVRNMALSLMLLDHMQDKAHAQQLKVEFLRTVMAGTLASELSRTSKEAEDAYLGALFRNLGRMLVSYYLPDDAEQIRLIMAGKDGEPPMTEVQAAQKVLGVPLDKLADKVGKMWGLPDGLRACMAQPSGTVPKQSLAARPERVWWMASLANAAADGMLEVEPGQLGDLLTDLSTTYAKALDLSPHALQDAASRARKRLTELTHALNMSVPTQSPADKLLDHYYVDAPNAAQTGGPSAQDLGLELTSADGALAVEMPLPEQEVANVLTNGIQDITNTLLESFKLNDVLHMILETMLRALNCRRVIFCLRDPKTGALLGRMGIGEQVDIVKSAFRIPLVLPAGTTPDLFSIVCLKNADMLIADAAAPTIVGRLPTWFRDQVQAPTFLLLPLVMKRKGQPDIVLGMIYADKGKANSLQVNEKELSLLRTLRNQAVMAFKQTTGG
ncbi:MAG TPA: HDOD domain-containing protein [Aquabacterium sp.]|uniref:HDOD domain-containing protein n=1 Tax=Aquabacterium sp. TaxID=1872578 RepID=UPI002E308272|nr:HDOD domain-containing protein [Aquabacterium sp.]HEX5356980.1 HDOD domain-containing protein [Aquabacterium sp.]